MTVWVLLDTGALGGSYLSRRLYDYLEPFLRDKTIHLRTNVTLADGVSSLPIDKLVRTSVLFDTQVVTIELYVIDIMSYDIIVGLSDIRRYLASYFVEMVLGRRLVPLDESREIHLIDNLHENIAHSAMPEPAELLLPAFTTVEDEAEEDQDDLPGSFKELLVLLGTPYEERKQAYIELLEDDKHIEKEFHQVPGVRELFLGKGLQVFVPNNWDGVKNKDGTTYELQIRFKAEMPDAHRPRYSHVSPALMATAKTEYERLGTYFLEKSESTIASPITIAGKATPPYVRLCGDYRWVNQFIEVPNYWIPQVREEILRMTGSHIFADLDMTNSFHQIKLDTKSSEKLSLKTPWGQCQPRFLPEGIAPATLYLHEYVRLAFADMEWVLVIFDNIVVMAQTREELLHRLDVFFDRCVERNISLKFPKSFIGFRHVDFFGYTISDGRYTLRPERLQTLENMEMPTSKEQMRSLLGVANFGGPFIDKFSILAAPLFEMVQTRFNWEDQSTWTRDYKACFDTFKREGLLKVLTLNFPDYNKIWILQTDASMVGVAGALFQIDFDEPQDTRKLQLTYLVSKKFSEPATRWSTIKQECYGIYYSIFQLQHWLRGKPFIIETDHQNLQWMEASEVPSIVRWRLFLQSFPIIGVRHIKRRFNALSDYYSKFFPKSPEEVASSLHFYKRVQSAYPTTSTMGLHALHHDAPSNTDTMHSTASEIVVTLSPMDMFRAIHNDKTGHPGQARTWQMLNRQFPDHPFAFAQITDLILQCAICQKIRLSHHLRLPSRVKTLTSGALHYRCAIGMDLLEIGLDKNHNRYAAVIINILTKAIKIYPQRGKDAIDAARALFSYCCDKYLFDELYTDRGSDYTSQLFTSVADWLGIKLRWSPVARPQGSGVEASNREILRHINALFMVQPQLTWSDPECFKLVEYVHNTNWSTASGAVPQDLEIGQTAELYKALGKGGGEAERQHQWLQLLNANLKKLREASIEFQENNRRKIEDKNPSISPTYKAGDFVLVHPDSMHTRRSKLHPKWLGPFKVLKHERGSNEVEFQCLVTGAIHKRHLEALKLFTGTEKEAVEAARLDQDQYLVDSILAYRGDYTTRSDMEFLVRFASGEEEWQRYSKDLYDTIPFEEFVRSNPRLKGLVYNAATENDTRKQLRKRNVTVQKGDTFYIDLRFFGYNWYKALNLPDQDRTTYRVVGVIKKIMPSHKRFDLHFPLFKQVYDADNYTLERECFYTTLPEGDVLVDSDFTERYPQILADNNN